jgi:hypothetical protein
MSYTDIERVVLIGVCHIERVGLIGMCHIERVGLIGVVPAKALQFLFSTW